MFRTQKFYMCEYCGNIVGVLNNTGIPMYCCRKEMKELTPNIINSENSKIYRKNSFKNQETSINNTNSNIFSVEKSKDGNSFSIIVDTDYLTPDSVCWAYLNTQKGGQRKNLLHDDSPIINFKIVDDEAVSAYFYCSNHGLFKYELE